MGKLIVFEMVSLDGYFVDAKGDMSWAHAERADEEWQAFVQGNAKGGGILVFGRITYEMMAGYWPSPYAIEGDPIVAERMNGLPKIVFSKTLNAVSWSNTRLVRSDMLAEVRRLKGIGGENIAIMGSGSLVRQLAEVGLIDEFQIVVIPVALGAGRTLFEGIGEKLGLKLIETRSFANGNVFLRYRPSV